MKLYMFQVHRLTRPHQEDIQHNTSESEQAEQRPVLMDHGYSEVKQVCSLYLKTTVCSKLQSVAN